MKKINWKELGKAGILLISYMIIIPGIVSSLFGILGLSLENNIYYILANLLVYVVTLILIFILYLPSLIEEFKLFIKNFKLNIKTGIHFWLKAFVFMILTNLIIVSIANGIATNEEANRSVIAMMPIFSIFTMCILGPFLEEILFRKSFKDVFANKKVFLIVSSLLFGGAHLLSAFTLGTIEQNMLQLLYIIPYGGIGYFFAKAYLETDTIFTSTLMHIFHNTLSVVIVLLSGLGV